MHPSWFQYVPPTLQAEAQRLIEISPFFTQLMRDATEAECQQLFQPHKQALLPEKSPTWLPTTDSINMNACMAHLRHIKQHAMRHIIWWELGIHGDIETSYHAITRIAEGILEQSIEMAKRLIQPRFGTLDQGSFCIIGLGKLGGEELNLGSDVDPLFLWQAEGSTQGGRTSVRANEYYNHLSRMIIKLISEYSCDGIAWIVDMRLRPGGDGAPICLSLEATLDHYLEYGQTWERAMLIKARPVAGDLSLGQSFIQGISPFVYRRYLDYSSVAALAEMKYRIDQQAGSSHIAEGFDVKRGHGGIREIEFTIQSMQLLHGGRDAALRAHEGKIALQRLCEKGIMQQAEIETLLQSYFFWRRVEHAVQARKGEQTHALAADYVAYLNQAVNSDHIEEEMQMHSQRVAEIFKERVLPIENQSQKTEQSWLHHAPLLESTALSPKQKDLFQQGLKQIDKQLSRDLLPDRSQQQIENILNIAMPCWIDDANGLQALRAFADLLHNIAGRATWIDLLATQKGALQWLIGVLSASRYIAEHMIKNPSWLEWPLSIHHHEMDDICKTIASLNGSDEGAFLAALGHAVDQGRMCCALHIDAHTVDSQSMGQWLSNLADAAVSACLRSSLQQLQLPLDFPMLALALGKHGSREMGLVSDLDMVFVVAGDADDIIHGRSIREWSQRLGRRMIRQLSGLPPFGAGYEFDARLRPSGNSGVLVTTLTGFEDYQRHEAQTWEHQALCRGRVITGSEKQRRQLEEVINQIIAIPREQKQLAIEVIKMREKIVTHLSSKDANIINLKHDRGGLVDLEFLAQYARLAWGGSYQGTVKTFENISPQAPQSWQHAAPLLAATYIDYRDMENALRVELWQSIGKLSRDAQAPEWETMRRHASIHTPEELQKRMQDVHQQFQTLLTD